MTEFLRNPPRSIDSSFQEYKQMQNLETAASENRFPSYHEATDVSPVARFLCETISQSPPAEVESALSATGVTPYSTLVEEVLKLLYDHPDGAVKFFRWSGFTKKPHAEAWSVMVDLLGKNEMFEQMWDAIRTMKQEEFLSRLTFTSAFESYCAARRFNEAEMTFDVMEKYGIEPDVVAVNSMLSSLFQVGKHPKKAVEFFEKVKDKIPPDSDTFVILLEGLGEAKNIKKSKTVFGEMIVRLGWDPTSRPAYEAFLTTLVYGSQTDDAIKFLQVMKTNKCLPSLNFFSHAVDALVEQNNMADAVKLWEIMLESGFLPNLTSCNAMISLLCNNNDITNAIRLLDEMVLFGSFPDTSSYNIIFQCLVKKKAVREVGSFFTEMVKNECPPSLSNCTEAIKMLFAQDDPEMATEIWNYTFENSDDPIEEIANAFLLGLCEMGRFVDMKRFAVEMLERRINLYQSTLERLKSSSRQDSVAQGVYSSLIRRLRDARKL